MAEGLLRHLGGDRFDVCSAGTHPSQVHPLSIRVMAELGIDLSDHTSDPIEKYLSDRIDIVITVCDDAQQVCPIFPGNGERLHWSTVDPFKGWDDDPRQLPAYRATRDFLRKHIEEFLHKH